MIETNLPHKNRAPWLHDGKATVVWLFEERIHRIGVKFHLAVFCLPEQLMVMVEDGVLEWREGVWSGIFPACSVPYKQNLGNIKRVESSRITPVLLLVTEPISLLRPRDELLLSSSFHVLL